jgi:hypothetical protein
LPPKKKKKQLNGNQIPSTKINPGDNVRMKLKLMDEVFKERRRKELGLNQTKAKNSRRRGPLEIYISRDEREWHQAYENEKNKGYTDSYEVFKKERLTRHREAKPRDGSFVKGKNYCDSEDSNSL